MSYPVWTFFPGGARAPEWVDETVGIVRKAEAEISSLDRSPAQESSDVLRALSANLVDIGFLVGKGTRPGQGLKLPVLFGSQGTPTAEYEVDAFNPTLGIVLEVEAGRGASNNLDYRDIVRSSLIEDARFLVMLQPQQYASNPKARPVRAYATTHRRISEIYATGRLGLALEGILLVGY